MQYYRLLVALCASSLFALNISAQEHIPPLYPKSSVLSATENFLLVPDNRGYVGLIDVSDKSRPRLVKRFKIGDSLTYISRIPDSNRFLVSAAFIPQLIQLELDEAKQSVDVISRCDIKLHSLRRIAIHPQQTMCAVASRWGRRLQFVNISGKDLSVGKFVDLPFAPGPLGWLTDEYLFVADAFSDRVALVNGKSAEIAKVWQRKGRRIGGLWVQPEQVLVTDIKLNSLAHTVESDIHWGLLMSNEIRGISIDSILQMDEKLHETFIAKPLGGPGDGKGDPTDIVVSGDLVATVLQGVNQIAFGLLDDNGFSYVFTGAKPRGLTVDRKAQTAYVCNSLDESITVIDLKQQTAVATLTINDQPREPTLLDRGERLFFDARLSHDGWMSCNSCHIDGHSNFLLNDNFSDQSFGAPKRVLSLLGHRNTLPLAWNGSMKSFEDQVRSSIENTMQSDSPAKPEDVEALVAFVKSLAAPMPVDEARQEVNWEAYQAGKAVFEKANCAKCHPRPGMTTAENFDVKLEDELGSRLFNPPSLIGVGQRDRFFHDGRANSLREVFVEFAHPGDDTVLTESEIDSLIQFLRIMSWYFPE